MSLIKIVGFLFSKEEFPKYRIRKEYCQDDTAWYTPQVKFGRFQKWRHLYEAIGSIDDSLTFSTRYRIYGDAISVIEKHIKQVKDERGKEVKKIQYTEINYLKNE